MRILSSSFAAVLVAGLIPAGAATAETSQWNPWVSAGGAIASSGSSPGEAIYWAPLWQTPSAVGFLDFRGKVFDGSYLEGNAALGLRAMLPGGYNFGIWGGYDARRSGASGNVFQQLSGGLEFLGDRTAFRANGYVPLTGAMAGGAPTVFLSGNDILMSGGQEIPLYGVDGEIGARLFATDEPGAPKQELWVYGGGFWFDNAAVSEAIAGPKARLEWQINDVLRTLPGSRLTFGAAVSHDPVRDTRFEASASLRIPIGGVESASVSAQYRRMADPLVRDTDVVVEGTTEHVEDAITGANFDRAVTVASGATSTELQDAISASGANSLVIVNGDRIGQWTLSDSQTLLGGGGTIAVRGLTSGTVADFTAAGVRPTLKDVSNDFFVTQSVIIANNNTHIAGLELNSVGKPLPDDYSPITALTADVYAGAGLNNIAVTGNVLRTSVDFDNPGGGILHSSIGAYFDGATNAIVRDNEIYAAGESTFGISFAGANGSSNRADDNVIHVTGPGAVGIQMSGSGGGARGNTIDLDGEGTRGIIVVSATDMVVDRNTITAKSGDRDYGIIFNNTTRSTLDHNTITAASGVNATGISVSQGTQSVVSNNTVSVGGSAIYVLVGSDNLSIEGNTLTAGESAIYLGAGSYKIANNVITGTVGGNVATFSNSHATVLANSSGNTIQPGAVLGAAICAGDTFSGTWSITDNSVSPAVLHTYVDGCSEP